MHAFLDFLKFFAGSLAIAAAIYFGVILLALLIELGFKHNDGHVSFATGGLLAACALDTWIIVSEPRLLWLWIALFAVIFALYRWYGAWLRRQDAKRHRHVFDTLEDVAEGYAMLACKCGAPYCLVRIVR